MNNFTRNVFTVVEFFFGCVCPRQTTKVGVRSSVLRNVSCRRCFLNVEVHWLLWRWRRFVNDAVAPQWMRFSHANVTTRSGHKWPFWRPPALRHFVSAVSLQRLYNYCHHHSKPSPSHVNSTLLTIRVRLVVLHRLRHCLARCQGTPATVGTCTGNHITLIVAHVLAHQGSLWLMTSVPALLYPWRIHFKNSSFNVSQWDRPRWLWSASRHVI